MTGTVTAPVTPCWSSSLAAFAEPSGRSISAFRPGGEEFVILLPETDIAGSLTAARRIGDLVRDSPFPLDGPSGAGVVAMTVSVGVAVYPRHARTGVDILDAADQALYAAKAAGRDTFVLAETPFSARNEPDLTPSVVAPCAPPATCLTSDR
jgi:predicted signal transduction protein with EAL and GGDEF domain